MIEQVSENPQNFSHKKGNIFKVLLLWILLLAFPLTLLTIAKIYTDKTRYVPTHNPKILSRSPEDYVKAETTSHNVIITKVTAGDKSFYVLTNLEGFKTETNTNKLLDCPMTFQPSQERDYCAIPTTIISLGLTGEEKPVLPYGQSLGSYSSFVVTKNLLEGKNKNEIDKTIEEELNNGLRDYIMNHSATGTGGKDLSDISIYIIHPIETAIKDKSEIIVETKKQTVNYVKFESHDKSTPGVISYYNIETSEGKLLGRIKGEELRVIY